MIDLYLYGSCSSCRNTREWLIEHGAEVRERDFFRNRFSREELVDVLARARLTPAQVISTRSKIYRERRLAELPLGDDELIDLMIEEPTLLRRPVVTGTNGSVVGFDRKGLERLIAGN